MDQVQFDAQPSGPSGVGKGGPVNLLPKEYASPANTELSATLDVGKNENISFALTSKSDAGSRARRPG
jgi:hypothetical protein